MQAADDLRAKTEETKQCWEGCGGVQKCALEREQCLDPWYNKDYDSRCREVGKNDGCGGNERKAEECLKGLGWFKWTCWKWKYTCCSRVLRASAAQQCDDKYQSCLYNGPTWSGIIKSFFKGAAGLPRPPLTAALDCARLLAFRQKQ